MILVDSSVWIDYFSGVETAATEKLDSYLEQELIAIGDLILTEVLQGFRREKDFQVARSLLMELTVFDMLGSVMAVKSAANYRSLRSRGITIRKTADVIIASFCIEEGLPLLFKVPVHAI